MNEYINIFLTTYAPTIFMALLTALFGLLGHALRRLADRYLDTTEKREIAKIAVSYVEQVYTELHGDDKLNKALLSASALLEKRGITYNTVEMTMLIEAALAEFNEAFGKS